LSNLRELSNRRFEKVPLLPKKTSAMPGFIFFKLQNYPITKLPNSSRVTIGRDQSIA